MDTLTSPSWHRISVSVIDFNCAIIVRKQFMASLSNRTLTIEIFKKYVGKAKSEM